MKPSTKLIRRPRVRRHAEQWRDIIHRYEQSGQTRDTFCTQQSLALSTFSRWRKRLRTMNTSSPLSCKEPAFVKFSTLDDAMVAPPSVDWDVELQLGADIVLRLRRQC